MFWHRRTPVRIFFFRFSLPSFRIQFANTTRCLLSRICTSPIYRIKLYEISEAAENSQPYQQLFALQFAILPYDKSLKIQTLHGSVSNYCKRRACAVCPAFNARKSNSAALGLHHDVTSCARARESAIRTHACVCV